MLKIVPCTEDDISLDNYFDGLVMLDTIKDWSAGHIAQLRGYVTIALADIEKILIQPSQGIMDRAQTWLNRNISESDLHFDEEMLNGKITIEKVLNSGFSDIQFQAFMVIVATFFTIKKT